MTSAIRPKFDGHGRTEEAGARRKRPEQTAVADVVHRLLVRVLRHCDLAILLRSTIISQTLPEAGVWTVLSSIREAVEAGAAPASERAGLARASSESGEYIG